MKKIVYIFLLQVISACNFSDETRELSGGWTFADEGHSNKVIDGGSNHIPCEIIEYGYNKDFIIATQKPTEECFIGKDTIVYKYGKSQKYYWIIVHSQKLTLGPMNESDFKRERRKHNVPDELEMRPIY